MSVRDLAQNHSIGSGVWRLLLGVDRTAYAWGLFRAVVDLSAELPASELWWSGSQRCTVWLNSSASPTARLGAIARPGNGHHVLASLAGRSTLLGGRGAPSGRVGRQGSNRWPVVLAECRQPPELQAWSSDSDAWQCWHDLSRVPIRRASRDNRGSIGHRAVGKGHELQADAYPWGWQDVEFNGENWQQPQLIGEVHGKLVG